MTFRDWYFVLFFCVGLPILAHMVMGDFWTAQAIDRNTAAIEEQTRVLREQQSCPVGETP
jgi:hypothetical protein